MNDNEHLQAIDELAAVFDEKPAAHDLLDRIDFPVARRPVFDPDPHAFWRRVYRDVQSGKTVGGPEELLRQASRLYPQNPVFKRLANDEDPSIPPRPVWNVPHRRNPFFTGRDDILASLHEALTDDGHAAIGQAIRGLGGIGKTQTAVEC